LADRSRSVSSALADRSRSVSLASSSLWANFSVALSLLRVFRFFCLAFDFLERVRVSVCRDDDDKEEKKAREIALATRRVGTFPCVLDSNQSLSGFAMFFTKLLTTAQDLPITIVMITVTKLVHGIRCTDAKINCKE
jgi:hypothetical protein